MLQCTYSYSLAPLIIKIKSTMVYWLLTFGSQWGFFMVLDKDLLDGIPVFLTVAEHSSFTLAAAQLGITPTAVSKAIRVLEERHGVVLFQRTTRKVALTEAGQALFSRLNPATQEIDEAIAALGQFREKPIGTLRLNMKRSACTYLVEPIVAEFRQKYPDVKLDITIDEGLTDLLEGRYDAGIRLGESVDKDMVGVRLTPDLAFHVVGSPEYFKRHGKPAKPEDLQQHDAIMYRFVTSGTFHRWEFVRSKRQFFVDLPSPVVVNNRDILINFARQGLGLAYVAQYEVERELAEGSLVPVLSEFIPKTSGLYLYFPARTQAQLKLRAFIDMVTKVRGA